MHSALRPRILAAAAVLAIAAAAVAGCAPERKDVALPDGYGGSSATFEPAGNVPLASGASPGAPTPGPAASATSGPQDIVTPDQPALALSGELPDYTQADMRSAFDWVTGRLIPRTYTFSGFWSNSPAYDPNAMWPYSQFVEKNFWAEKIAPLLLEPDALKRNAAFLTTIAPLPPELPDGQFRSSPPVASFTFGDPGFDQQEDGSLKVTAPYTARGYFNNATGQVSSFPIRATLAVYLAKSEVDGWVIVGWDNSVPQYGAVSVESVKPGGLTLGSATEGPGPVRMTMEELRKQIEKAQSAGQALGEAQRSGG